MKLSEMSESGDCLQDLSSGEFEGDEEYKTTYATLTPLRPLSPISDSEKCPSRGGYWQNGLYSISDTSFSLRYNRDLDTGLKGYEFLEPLLPIAMLDGSGNMECCEVQPSLSLYRQASLLLPLAKDLDSSMSSEGLYSNTAVPGVSPFANGNQSGGTDSIQSSRSSTPDIVAHDSSTKRPLASVIPAVSPASDAFELNVDMEDVDTREIAEKVSNELKKYNISQVLFAQTILGRSQGTLSDLLRNPKPWAKLKSGRETFCRMWKWLQVPEDERMAPFKGAGFKSESPKVEPIVLSVKPKPEATPKATPDAKSKSCSPTRSASSKAIQFESDLKKRRMVFTDAQRASLRNIFRKTPRPSRELQLSIAHQLGLPVGTVSNFFMNARRRPRVKWQDDIHRTAAAALDDDSTTNSGSDAF